MVLDKELLESAKSGLRRAGRKELITYLEGGKISRPGAVKAKCFDCDGMGGSGECDVKACALYPFSPYRQRIRAVSAKSEGKTTDIEVSVNESNNSKSHSSKETIVEEGL